jgi:hypothetical protein
LAAGLWPFASSTGIFLARCKPQEARSQKQEMSSQQLIKKGKPQETKS